LIQTSQDRSHNNKNKQTSMLKFHQKTISLVFSLLLKPETTYGHGDGRMCGTKSLTPEEKAESKEVTAKWKASGKRFVADDIVIPTYFHIINPDQNDVTGNEQAQVDKLNEGFAGSGFSFNLEETTTTNSDDWWDFSVNDTATDEAMKADSRVGDCGTLNVWWTDISDLSGYAYLANFCPCFMEKDGVVMDHTTSLGGSAVTYNEGNVLIHEVGHWMGLLHTFDGGCGGDGDLVDDTPEVAESNYGSNCDEEVDSCPNDGLGPDMLENYMDYANCKNAFTPGQIERMIIQWNEYRDCEESTERAKLLKAASNFFKL